MRCGIALMAAVISLAGCTVQQQSGGDIRLNPPTVFTGQAWSITRQAALDDGSRVCTIAIGQVDVTQRSRGGRVSQQVAYTQSLDPGAHFKILVGSHVYDTVEGWFSPADSLSIINDFSHAPKAYSEVRALELERRHTTYRNFDNSFDTQGFTPLYMACEQFVRGG
jgi:hypothetical protein